MFKKIKEFFCFHKWEEYFIYPNINLDIKGKKCKKCGYDFTMKNWR